MKKILISIAIFLLLPVIIYSQDKSSIISQSEIDEMKQALKEDSLLVQIVNRLGGDAEKLYKNFKKNILYSDSLFKYNQEHIKPFHDLGCTRRFELLPLIDWFTVDDSLSGEAGVAYLIRTDDTTILFDVGLNKHDTDPSPLLMNMNKLGVNLEDIDVIVISHPHGDHTGGSKWSQKNTFSLTSTQLDLGNKQIFTPIPMTYPGQQPIHSPQPTKIAKGVATIGIISCPLFHDLVQEQALAFNVENKGIVIVSGCGHQTIEKMLQRTERLFTEPIYGLLGGFHLPISVGRNITKIYQYFITNRLPWMPLTETEISHIIDLMKQKGVKIVGISGHDSCDSSISLFREAFGNSYFEIAVGNIITLN
jgi:7,8-dihydropterin-6-yl-methyl-4-(beta-D-ribofuranosyl)aminobenzene 5'-phosphate synthase